MRISVRSIRIRGSANLHEAFPGRPIDTEQRASALLSGRPHPNRQFTCLQGMRKTLNEKRNFSTMLPSASPRLVRVTS